MSFLNQLFAAKTQSNASKLEKANQELKARLAKLEAEKLEAEKEAMLRKEQAELEAKLVSEMVAGVKKTSEQVVKAADALDVAKVRLEKVKAKAAKMAEVNDSVTAKAVMEAADALAYAPRRVETISVEGDNKSIAIPIADAPAPAPVVIETVKEQQLDSTNIAMLDAWLDS